MTQALALGLLRHLLQAAAGIAVAKGWIADSDTETLIGYLLSIATAIWYIVDYLRTRHTAKVADAVQQMASATKGLTDAVQLAATSEPSGAMLEAVAAVPGARAALDRASMAVRQ